MVGYFVSIVHYIVTYMLWYCGVLLYFVVHLVYYIQVYTVQQGTLCHYIVLLYSKVYYFSLCEFLVSPIAVVIHLQWVISETYIKKYCVIMYFTIMWYTVMIFTVWHSIELKSTLI